LEFSGLWSTAIAFPNSFMNGKSQFGDFRDGFYDPLQCLSVNDKLFLKPICTDYSFSSTGDLFITFARILNLDSFNFHTLAYIFLGYFGLSFFLAFKIISSFKSRFHDKNLKLILLIIYISPPVLLGVERGQMDFLTFSLIINALYFSLKKFHFASLIMLSVAVTIKILFLPVFLIYIFLLFSQKILNLKFLFTISLIIPIINIFINFDKYISAVSNQGARTLSFGFANIPYWTLELLFKVRQINNWNIFPNINANGLNIEDTNYWIEYINLFNFLGITFSCTLFAIFFFLLRRFHAVPNVKQSESQELFFTFSLGFYLASVITMISSMHWDYKLVLFIPPMIYFTLFNKSNFSINALTLSMIFIFYNSWGSTFMFQYLADFVLYVVVGFLGALHLHEVLRNKYLYVKR
jgi:hypothetical protein